MAYRPPREDTKPWYRQFWPWFLIALPMTAVVGGITTVVIAERNAPALVVDDYAKIGLITKLNEERDAKAQALGLDARLHVTRDEGAVSVLLRGQAALPKEVTIKFWHPADAKRDQTVTLQQMDGGLYSGRSRGPMAGRWYVVVEPPDKSWRLTGHLTAGSDELSMPVKRGG